MVHNQIQHSEVRMQRLGLILTMLISGLMLIRTVGAESIWSRRSDRYAFPLADNVATDVGDSLTVIIADSSGFTKEGERTMEKQTSHDSAAEISTDGKQWFDPLSVAEDSERRFESENEYESSRTLNDRITVTVVDKLPNGNLVIGGRRERRVEGEDVTTVLTGIVKPEVISGDNTVPSTRVAHAKIHYETDGTSDAFMNQGFISRIVNYLWPF
jgi:flagellar L-ring protein precursor FlgH